MHSDWPEATVSLPWCSVMHGALKPTVTPVGCAALLAVKLGSPP